MYRERYQVVHQRLSRHQLFANGGLTPIDALIGVTVRFFLFSPCFFFTIGKADPREFSLFAVCLLFAFSILSLFSPDSVFRMPTPFFSYVAQSLLLFFLDLPRRSSDWVILPLHYYE